jgi:hypothetical protein
MKLLKTISLILVTIYLSGCTSYLGKFAILSTKDVDMSKQYEKMKEPVEGSAATHIIILFPTSLSTIPLFAEATIDAMTRSGADFLENAEIETSAFYIPFIYGKFMATVKGTGYKLK